MRAMGGCSAGAQSTKWLSHDRSQQSANWSDISRTKNPQRMIAAKQPSRKRPKCGVNSLGAVAFSSFL